MDKWTTGCVGWTTSSQAHFRGILIELMGRLSIWPVLKATRDTTRSPIAQKSARSLYTSRTKLHSVRANSGRGFERVLECAKYHRLWLPTSACIYGFDLKNAQVGCWGCCCHGRPPLGWALFSQEQKFALTLRFDHTRALSSITGGASGLSWAAIWVAVPGFTEPRTVSPLNRIDDVLTLTADPVEILPTELLKRPMHARAHNLSVASSG